MPQFSNAQSVYSPLRALVSELSPTELTVITGENAKDSEGNGQINDAEKLSLVQSIAPVPVSLLSHNALQDDPPTQRMALVFVPWLLETLTPAQARHLIAQLRDVYAKRLLIATRGHNAWSGTDFVAMGLENIAEMEIEGETVRYAGFDIRTYKHTPDWLNPRFWANPERWNKTRW